MVIGLVVNIVVIAVAWGKLSERIKTLFNRVVVLEKSEEELTKKHDLLKDKINDNSLEDEKRHSRISDNIRSMQLELIKSIQEMFNTHSESVRAEFKELETRIHNLTTNQNRPQ